MTYVYLLLGTASPIAHGVSAWSTLPVGKVPSRCRHRPKAIPAARKTILQLSDENDDPSGGSGLSPQRRRKRDIIKRTLGLGGGTNGIISNQPKPDEISFEKQGQRRDVDLLSQQEEDELKLKYSGLQSESESLIDERLADGSLLEDVYKNTDELNTTQITADEARRIVDYTVSEEMRQDKFRLNSQRKAQMIQDWDLESASEEAKVDAELYAKSLQSGASEALEDILSKDGVAREIIEEDEARQSFQMERDRQIDELDDYERQLLREKLDEISESSVDASMGFDEMYRQALDEIQSSRSKRLGPKTIGIMANSIPLEQGREWLRSRDREREFLSEVERLAGLNNASDDEIEAFFKKPQTYEEERMYRSIVRRIVEKREESRQDQLVATSTATTTDPDDDEGEELYALMDELSNRNDKLTFTLSPQEVVEAYKLLGLWREVQSSEDEMRVALGLREDDSKPRVTNKLEPFFLYEEDSEETRAKEKEQLAKTLELGLETNDAVERSSNDLLMNELLEGGITPDRAVRLLDKMAKRTSDKTILYALQEMKESILNDKGTSEETDKVANKGPIDLSGVFVTSNMNFDDEPATYQSLSGPVEPTGRALPAWAESPKQLEENELPPKARFFAGASPPESTSEPFSPPPNSAFFEGGAIDPDREEIGGMFGTYNQQKLQQLAKKIGVQSDEEMEDLERNMEALREAEELANAKLSDDDFDIEAASAELGIDIDSLNLDNIDEEGQVSAILGKRPVSAPPVITEDEPGDAESVSRDNDGPVDIIVDRKGKLRKMTTKKTPDIEDDRFRAQTAGRYTDRESFDRDEAAYKDFLREQAEAEMKFDDEFSGETVADDLDININDYADDIMSEMGPRPQGRPSREEYMSQEDLRRERKMESVLGDEYDPFPVQADVRQNGPGGMPEWFRKEQEAQGVRVEDMDAQEIDEARLEWEREERQRQADEYFKRKGEGISISDILGREYFGPMDQEEDYKSTYSPFSGYEARKAELLTYTELTVEDINNVVDYKVDPLATGRNRYLARVQNPFSELGAIFRLEGVLVDVIGLHAQAWKNVSDMLGFRIQSNDELRRASLYKAEDAVREVFYWTDDIFEVENVADAQRAALQDIFSRWAEEGETIAEPYDRFTPSYSSSTPRALPSKEEMTSMYKIAWSKLASDMNRDPPTDEQVGRGILVQDWEVAVKEVFGWSDDPTEVYNIVVAYDQIVQKDYRDLLSRYNIDVDKIDEEQEEIFPEVQLKEGVKDWLNTLNEVELPVVVMSNLNSAQLDTILEATGLSSYFPPDKRVSSDNNYSDRSEYLGAALRVEQRPEKCVVFDNTPIAATVAHDVTMKCVSLVDHYARYELLTADFSVQDLRDINLVSLNKLFDERNDMDLELELDMYSGLKKEDRKVKTDFYDDDR